MNIVEKNMHDKVDIAILSALQADGSLTNAALSEKVNLSASQCSRRRAALEDSGVIVAYRAQLDAVKLGYTIEALTRVSLTMHSETASDEFTQYLTPLGEVLEVLAVTGDADYVLRISAASLEQLAEFIHRQLLPHPAVGQVKTDIVLRTIKQNSGVRLD